jgi:hypothetical protein
LGGHLASLKTGLVWGIFLKLHDGGAPMAHHDSVVKLDLNKLLGFSHLSGKDLPASGDEARAISPEILGATFTKSGKEVPPTEK